MAAAAADEIGALADRIDRELPVWIERIRLIDAPALTERRAA
jgi:hypothetical protein